MATINEVSESCKAGRLDKRTLILEVRDAIGKCGTDIVQQISNSLHLTQSSCEKRHQQTQEGMKSTRLKIRGFEAFQGEVVTQMNQLESRVNLTDDDLYCVQSDVKGQHSGDPELLDSADIQQLCLTNSRLLRNVALLSGRARIQFYPMRCKSQTRTHPTYRQVANFRGRELANLKNLRQPTSSTSPSPVYQSIHAVEHLQVPSKNFKQPLVGCAREFRFARLWLPLQVPSSNFKQPLVGCAKEF